MAPNADTQVITDEFHVHDFSVDKIGTDRNYKYELVWSNIILLGLLHIFGIYGIYLIPTLQWNSILYFIFFAYFVFAPSVIIGAHRLYTHRTMKAVWPLRLFLITGFTALGQNALYTWVRDHRMHHKYTDTDADPHNAQRGLFFSHVGWLMCRKHPVLKEKGKGIFMDDLKADPMVMFQRKYYYYLYFLTNFLYIYAPVYFWGESLANSFFCLYAAHYILSLHGIWTINSFAHYTGSKPYDSNIQAADNWLIQLSTMGEGMHNYHHTFPWDWKSANEVSTLGWKQYSFSTMLIEIFAHFGLIYDRKSASQELIMKRAKKTGDGSYKPLNLLNNNEL